MVGLVGIVDSVVTGDLVDMGVSVMDGTALIGDLAMVMDGRVDMEDLAIGHGICIVRGGHTIHSVIRITTTPIVTDLVFG